MLKTIAILLAGISALIAAAFEGRAQQAAGGPIAIGMSHTIQSKQLSDTREVNVRVPASYAKSPERRYPVLYVLDGGIDQDFPHIAGLAQHGEISWTFDEYIVVGIQTKNRIWELTPPTTDERYTTFMRANGTPVHFAGGGGIMDFRDHLAREVIPFVEANYRTKPGRRTLIGESLAAYFVVHTLLNAPAHFDDYVSISPSLWWNREALPAAAPGLLARHAHAGKRLYITMASEGGTGQRGLDTLLKALRTRAARDLQWIYVDRSRSEHHGSIYHAAALDALRTLSPKPFRPGTPLPWLFVGDMPKLSAEAEADKKMECTTERAKPVTFEQIAADPERWEALCTLPILGHAPEPVERSANWGKR